jgi:hypothetical protein
MKSFLQRHRSNVLGVLSGLDRVRFRGTVRLLAHVSGMMGFLSVVGVLLKNFKQYAMGVTEQTRCSIEQRAAAAGLSIQYLNNPALRKEDLAREIAERNGIVKGPICVLSAVEPCYTYHVGRNRERKLLELRRFYGKCLHHYLYVIDPVFGFCHVRLQTWFPFTVHLCINGREWLARQLNAAKIGFVKRDNTFTWIEDPVRAQTLMNRQLRLAWPKHLERLLRQLTPVPLQLFGDWNNYYWSADETEWATDVMFDTPEALAELYPRLIDFGVRRFGSADVMRFLGHKLPGHGGVHGRFAGEIVSDLKTRPEGMCLKHRVNRNVIKMYDKQGSVLRIETTINHTGDFSVYRTKEGDPKGDKQWRPLRKGVADLHRRAKVSQRANERYLASLASVDASAPLGQLAGKLCRRVEWKGKTVRALNPLADQDAALLAAVHRGEYAVNGFRNRDLRGQLFPQTDASKEEIRRQSAKVSRLLRLLQAHGLIYKVQRTHRYLLTTNGQLTIAALLTARKANPAKLANAA